MSRNSSQSRLSFASRHPAQDMRSSERRPASNRNNPPTYGASFEDFEFGRQYQEERAQLLGAVSTGQEVLLDEVLTSDPQFDHFLESALREIYNDPTNHPYSPLEVASILKRFHGEELPEGIQPVGEFLDGLWKRIDAEDASRSAGLGSEAPIIPPAPHEEGGPQ